MYYITMLDTFDKEACGLHPLPHPPAYMAMGTNLLKWYIFIINKGWHSTVLAQYSDQYIRLSPLSARITLPKINISVFGST